MTTYRQRREARADRLDEWASKRAAKAEAAEAHAQALSSVIPFGQPILSDHYSAGRDRRYRDRIGRTYDQAYEHAAKAESMASRAANIRDQLDRSIYSDDPDAVEQLTARLAELEAERERITQYNASCRRGAPDVSILDDHQRAELVSIAQYSSLGKGGAFPAYVGSNLSGRIKRTRDRLMELTRQDWTPPTR